MSAQPTRWRTLRRAVRRRLAEPREGLADRCRIQCGERCQVPKRFGRSGAAESVGDRHVPNAEDRQLRSHGTAGCVRCRPTGQHAAENVSFTTDEQIDFEAGDPFIATERPLPVGHVRGRRRGAAFGHSEQGTPGARSRRPSISPRRPAHPLHVQPCDDRSGTFEHRLKARLHHLRRGRAVALDEHRCPSQIIGGTGDDDEGAIIGHGGLRRQSPKHVRTSESPPLVVVRHHSPTE